MHRQGRHPSSGKHWLSGFKEMGDLVRGLEGQLEKRLVCRQRRAFWGSPYQLTPSSGCCYFTSPPV